MLKILHCADLHLDSPFADALGKGEARKTKLRATFPNLISYCAAAQVQVVLIAGDLFDSTYVSRQTLSMLAREMASLPDVHFFIAPGNHDPYFAGSIWDKAGFPANVTIFKEARVEKVSLPELNVDVYGYGFTSPSLERAPIDDFRVEDETKINLLIAHADVGGTLSSYAPTTKEALGKTGADYVALGHIHAASGPEKVQNTYFAYPGCIQGRGFDERGHKGALVLEIEKEGGVLSVRSSAKRFSLGRYEVAGVDLTGVTSVEEGVERTRDYLIEENLVGDDTTLRLVLTGSVSPECEELEERVKEDLSSRFYALEVRDTTAPIWGAQTLENDLTIRGEFYRSLKPMLESSDPDERRRAAGALRMGLSALAGQVKR